MSEASGILLSNFKIFKEKQEDECFFISVNKIGYKYITPLRKLSDWINYMFSDNDNYVKAYKTEWNKLNKNSTIYIN